MLSEDKFADVSIWELPRPAPGSTHRFKYRLALVVNDECVLRFDNEAGKGDHKHVGANRARYTFTTLDQLVDDFWHDVENWRSP